MSIQRKINKSKKAAFSFVIENGTPEEVFSMVNGSVSPEKSMKKIHNRKNGGFIRWEMDGLPIAHPYKLVGTSVTHGRIASGQFFTVDSPPITLE